jgi:hypothetical protein
MSACIEPGPWVTPGVLQPSPLKESHPEIGRDPLVGYQEGVSWGAAVSFNQVALINCSSNVILFATSEGSPFRFLSTTYSTFNN